MDIRKNLIGATLATTVALAFTAAPITLAVADQAKVHCYGVNSCKGTSACKTNAHACKGLNSCKGQGYLDLSTKECKKKGGSLKDTSSPSGSSNNGAPQ